MVSRRSTGPLRKILPAVAVGLIALGVTACSSGQVTQTDQAEPAVNGTKGDVGDIALRDVLVAFPASGGYEAGEEAPLTLAIVNTGGTDDVLTSVSSPAAAKVELVGRGALPARSGLQVVVPNPSAEPAEPTESAEPSATSSAPSSGASQTSSAPPSETSSAPPSATESDVAPEDVGTMSIVLTGLTKDLPMGKNVPITFMFAEAGQITINVPIDSPEAARDDSAAE